MLPNRVISELMRTKLNQQEWSEEVERIAQNEIRDQYNFNVTSLNIWTTFTAKNIINRSKTE